MEHIKDLSNDKLADTNSEAFRFHCEVLSVVRMYRQGGADKVKSFLLQVEKHRGTDSANRLREAAWQEIKLAKISR